MLSSGSIVGNVKIGRLLGRGAMGEVYSGEQISLRRPVAIKRIASHLADDEDIIHRFAREAQVVALINSPHVVAVYEFGKFIDDDKDEHYLIVMELVDGGFDLKSCIGSEITWQQACSVIMQVAEGLAAAVEHDVIHRDIKPDNIMLSKKGLAKLADFGLAKSVDSTAMTMQGTLMGTPNYMPPEACRGEEVDARGDIYSLGATWYHLLSGQSLFSAANTMALLRAHCDETPKHIGECVPDLPAEVADLLMSCVAKDVADRPQSADALHKALLKTEGIPHKIPELIRMIKPEDKSHSAASESTMATVSIGSSSTAATIVTGQYANNSNNDETFVVEKDVTQVSGAAAPIADNENTLMPSTTATEKIEPAKKSYAGLVAVGVIVCAAIVAAVILSMTADEDALAVATTTTAADQTQDAIQDAQVTVTPTVKDLEPTDTQASTVTDVPSKPEPVIEVEKVDIMPFIATCSAAIAQKQFAEAEIIYEKIAQESDQHQDLLKSIRAGKMAQARASADLDMAMKGDDFGLMAAGLKNAAQYPELKFVYEKELADYTQKLKLQDDQRQQNQQRKQLEKLITDVEAALAAKKITQARNAYTILASFDADKENNERKITLQKLETTEKQQQKIIDTMAAYKKAGHYVLLSGLLTEANGWSDLHKLANAYRQEIVEKSSSVLKGLKSVPGLIQAREWKEADTVLNDIGDDARAIGETAAGVARDQRAVLQQAASDEVDRAFEQAIAAIGAGQSQQAKQHIASCEVAAQVSGRKKQWAAKARAINDIIDGKN